MLVFAGGVGALRVEDAADDVDPIRTAVEGINSPMHVLSLVAMGMPLIDNMDLEALAREAAEQAPWYTVVGVIDDGSQLNQAVTEVRELGVGITDVPGGELTVVRRADGKGSARLHVV